MYEPDPQVVDAARRGGADAFAVLVRGYQGDIWRLCFHLLHDSAAADDATQETFVRAFRFLRRYRGESKFSTWLFSVARNCALDELRRSGRQRKLAERLDHQPPPPSRDEAVAVEVREALALLPLELREPVVLIDMFGTSYKEVASILKIPEGTVKSRVHRARELLADALFAERRSKHNEA